MEGNPATSAAGGGGGGPAPFLLKTYDMVDDSSTDEIVSWSSNRNSFVVWNPPEFARLLLPTYFKHNNFSSFIRQLNTYGFRKIDPERWEFANEDFAKNQKHLLKNIHRRKPIHSHSNPQGSPADPERAAFEEEIDKLSREKNTLEKSISRLIRQQPATKLQLENLTQQVDTMEQKQDNLLAILRKGIQNPGFVEHLAQKLESMDFSADNKKRRLPQVENSQSFPEDSFVDNQSPSRPEFGNVFHDDFSSKLRLELSPAISDVNLVSHSTQSSNEDGGSPQIRLSEGCMRNTQTRPAELSDTGTSFTFNMGSSFVHKTNEEAEGQLSCQLKLGLASSISQINTIEETGKHSELIANPNHNEDHLRVPENTQNSSVENVTLTSSRTAQTDNQAQGRVNDVFWEQFLTERPGSSDVEEASSNFRAAASYEQEDRRSYANTNMRNLQNLTL